MIDPWVYLTLAVWPVLGAGVLGMTGWWLRRQSLPTLPSVSGPVEALQRMYLWPLVLWRLRQALKAYRR